MGKVVQGGRDERAAANQEKRKGPYSNAWGGKTEICVGKLEKRDDSHLYGGGESGGSIQTPALCHEAYEDSET